MQSKIPHRNHIRNDTGLFTPACTNPVKKEEPAVKVSKPIVMKVSRRLNDYSSTVCL